MMFSLSHVMEAPYKWVNGTAQSFLVKNIDDAETFCFVCISLEMFQCSQCNESTSLEMGQFISSELLGQRY